MRKGLMIFVLWAALVASAEAYGLVPEQSVFSGPRNDASPAADWNGAEEVLSWSRSRAGHPNRYDAWVQVATNAPIKLNLGGQGWAGGIDYPTVAYRRVLNGQSNIYLYDLSDDTRPSTPAGINTGKNEYRPTISGDWLLFGRDDNNGRVQRIVLHNSSTGNERQIAFARRSRALLLPGQINGAFASYMRCDPVCNVHVYSIVTRSTYILPKPTPATHQYSSAVAPNGAVYVARAGNDCGANVRIVRYLEVGDPREGTVIARLPDRRDIGYMSARQSTDGTVEVFYGRFHCRTDTWDLYKVTDAPGPP